MYCKVWIIICNLIQILEFLSFHILSLGASLHAQWLLLTSIHWCDLALSQFGSWVMEKLNWSRILKKSKDKSKHSAVAFPTNEAYTDKRMACHCTPSLGINRHSVKLYCHLPCLCQSEHILCFPWFQTSQELFRGWFIWSLFAFPRKYLVTCIIYNCTRIWKMRKKLTNLGRVDQLSLTSGCQDCLKLVKARSEQKHTSARQIYTLVLMTICAHLTSGWYVPSSTD